MSLRLRAIATTKLLIYVGLKSDTGSSQYAYAQYRKIRGSVCMSVVVKRIFDARIAFIWLGSVIMLAGCTSVSLPPGAIGNAGKYNYSPSIIEEANTRQFWWRSKGRNPNDSSMDTDAIFYASMNLVTHEVSSPVLVLAESPGTWDAAYTCNPKVFSLVFQNPLDNVQK